MLKLKNAKWLLLSLIIIVIDQYTKYLVSQQLQLSEPVALTSFFNLTLKHNYGAAFSFLSGASGWQRWFFSGIAIVVSFALVTWLLRLPREKKWLACALAFIFAGAVSNLYDRIALGYVIDFLHFHIHQYSWPVFNAADMAISVGAFMLVIDILFFSEKA